jgi:dihydropteroate synthase
VVLAGLDRLRALGRPICVGASRKSFIGEIAGEPDPARRLPGSLAAASAAVLAGAHMIRAHDVADTVQAVRVAEAVRGAREGT